MFRQFLFVMLAMAAAGPGTVPPANAADDNVHFTGSLVAEPCVIPPGEESIPLEFGTVIDKYLYENQRTHSEDFTLHLTECDPAIAGTVTVTFSGIPSGPLPGLLALDGGSVATGVAIGLENGDGSALKLEEATAPVSITNGEMQLPFRAYVQAEPQAVSAHTIGLGEFTATATFSLGYE